MSGDHIAGMSGHNSIRSYLGSVIGKQILEVTCGDEYRPRVLTGKTTTGDEERIEVPVKEIYLHLENGSTITFFAIEDQLSFCYDGDT